MIFRRREDIYPVVTIILGLILGLLPVFFGISFTTVVPALLGIGLRLLTPIHQHYHSHRPTFTPLWANSLYDLILGVAGGNPTQVWRLHHCLGHHVDYLDPKNDLEGNQRFGTGFMHQEVFTVLGDALSLFDSWLLAGRRLKGKAKRKARGILLLETFLLLLVLVGLFFINAKATFLFIIMPNFFLRWAVFWFSYRQHEGALNTSVYDSSVTNFKNNRFLLNVGLHTAHHKWPSEHWSQLEDRSLEIVSRIPAHLVKYPTYDGHLNTAQDIL